MFFNSYREKRKIFFALPFFALPLLALLAQGILSCSDTKAIFAEIEKEEVIKTTNLPNNISPLGMVRLGDTYFLATSGALYKRGVNDDTWATHPLPDGYEGISSLVRLDASNAYAILIKGFYVEITDYALYKLTGTGASDTGISFEAKQSVSAQTAQLTHIFLVPGVDNVYATLMKPGQSGAGAKIDYYQDYQSETPRLMQYSSDTETYDAVDRNDLITDVVERRGTLYVSTQTQLFTLSNNILAEVEVKDSSENHLVGYLEGMYLSLDDDLYLSSHERIWKFNGATWTSAYYSEQQFTKFTEINQPGFTGILVGTRYSPSFIYQEIRGKDDGYYELENGDISNLVSPSGNKYTSGTLDEAGVRGFFNDRASNTLFVFTNKQGLWRGSYASTRDVDWFHE